MSTKRGFVKKKFFFTIFTMFLFHPDLNMQIIFICNLSPKINIKNLKNLLILKGWSINQFIIFSAAAADDACFQVRESVSHGHSLLSGYSSTISLNNHFKFLAVCLVFTIMVRLKFG